MTCQIRNFDLRRLALDEKGKKEKADDSRKFLAFNANDSVFIEIKGDTSSLRKNAELPEK